MGRLCYPTHPGRKAVSRNRGTKFLRPGKEGMARVFAVQLQSFIAFWCDPGTRFIGATNLSTVTKFGEGTGAVSRYNLSRSKKFVKVYWILIACKCAYPGAETITNLSLVQK